MSDDWFDLIAALLDADVRFVVVGAHALAIHGVPRATQDIDLLVDTDTANVLRLWRALAEFGAPFAGGRCCCATSAQRAVARTWPTSGALGEEP